MSQLALTISLGLAAMLAQFVFMPIVSADRVDEIGSVQAPPIPSAKPDGNTGLPAPRVRAETSTLASRRRACPALVTGAVEATYLPPVRTETLCGAEAPLQVTVIDGVRLQPVPQLNCAMTGAMVDFIHRAKTAARNRLQDALTTIDTASSYVCRRRNNKPDGKFSEHATMNALDIAGFTLKSGARVTVLDDWRQSEEPAGSFLRDVHKAACRTFTTVLGPDADIHHQNHFHFDLGCHGKRCTLQICQ